MRWLCDGPPPTPAACGVCLYSASTTRLNRLVSASALGHAVDLAGSAQSAGGKSVRVSTSQIAELMFPRSACKCPYSNHMPISPRFSGTGACCALLTRTVSAVPQHPKWAAA